MLETFQDHKGAEAQKKRGGRPGKLSLFIPEQPGYKRIQVDKIANYIIPPH